MKEMLEWKFQYINHIIKEDVSIFVNSDIKITINDETDLRYP